ncbi:MAG TPA: glycosyltransferase family 4 protein [Chloroflexota bacterium]|nr:glycosyltransferase family 4 protein [Chloroflexota bacterium]
MIGGDAAAAGGDAPLRILHVITSLARGGAQAHLLTLMRGQKQRGHQVELAYLKEPVMAREFADVVPIPLQTHLGMSELGDRAYAAILGRLWGLVSAVKPEVLHTHLLKADALGAVAGRFGGARVTIASKHNDEAALRRPTVARLHGWLSHLDDRVIVLSDHVGRYVTTLGRVPATKVRRVYYGIELNRPVALARSAVRAVRQELDLPPEGPFLLCVGRLDPQKGHPTLLDAMARVLEREPAARLVLVGGAQQADPDYVAELRTRAAAPDLVGKVTFAGERTDVPRLMAACDVFVLASEWEGFGLVLVEAMATGKPVVATSVSGIPEVVVQGETGLLVPPHDPSSFATAVLSLLHDPAECRRLGTNGYHRVRTHFTADRMVDETIAVYREALAARARA